MSTTILDHAGTLARRHRLYGYIQSGNIGPLVLAELLPEGQPHQYEKQLWDYKLEIPTRAVAVRLGAQEERLFEVRMAELIKDVVAFFNTCGGYVVVGVNNTPRQIVGFNRDFDCDDLIKRVRGATTHEIDCHYALLDYKIGKMNKRIGLLHIPKRPDGQEPAQFLRDAPEDSHGTRAFSRYSIYLRAGSESRPATSSADFNFLCSPGRRTITFSEYATPTPVLDNNLGPRDPGFIRFVGRENYLQGLWRWLCDRYCPGKLLSGLGGVGKTTIAREFAEDVIRSGAMGFERVIWLSAKKQFYTAILNRYVPATRVDFVDVASLLRALLSELGYPSERIPQEWTVEELFKELAQALHIIPSLVILDDIDSLDPEQQSEAFHTMLKLMGQTTANVPVASRVLLTARLELGASPSQLIRVSGLPLEEFCEYVRMAAEVSGLTWTLKSSTKQMQRFHAVTDGSPTFASSILRLLQLGEKLSTALDRWKGSDREEVRKFAFRKELERLTDSQLRTLYTASILGDTSQLELKQITQSSDVLLDDDLGELRQYHLVALGSELPSAGARLIVPPGVRLMADIIAERLRNPKEIKKRCAMQRAGTPKLGADVGFVVHRVVALWRDGRFSEALEVAKLADTKIGDNPDIKCLLGRAYLMNEPRDPQHADIAFRRAHELGCTRPELMSLWLETKRALNDWVGLLEVSRLADVDYPSIDNIYNRGFALFQIAEIESTSGRYGSAAARFHEAGKEITGVLGKSHVYETRIELMELRTRLFQRYVEMVDKDTPDADAHLNVWLAVCDAYKSLAWSSDLITLGIARLSSWWSAVEARSSRDKSTSQKMRDQLNYLYRIKTTLEKRECPVELIKLIESRWTYLLRRLESYEIECE